MADDKKRQAKRVAAENGVYVAQRYAVFRANHLVQYQPFWSCGVGSSTHVPCFHSRHVCARSQTLQFDVHTTDAPSRSFLTKPDSIVQSLTHALVKLLPGVGVSTLKYPDSSIPRDTIASAVYPQGTYQCTRHVTVANIPPDNSHNLRPCHPRALRVVSLLDLRRIRRRLRRRPSHGPRRRTRQRPSEEAYRQPRWPPTEAAKRALCFDGELPR
jgi:hypothetical protein